MSPRPSVAVLLALSACRGPAVPEPAAPAPLPIVPRPEHMTRLPGWFALDPSTPILLSDSQNAELAALGEQARAVVRDETGLDLRVAGQGDAARGAIALVHTPTADTIPGAYRLTVEPAGITVSAPTPAGLFYGLQTLRQLLPRDPDAGSEGGAHSVPAVEIVDRPRFPYRGMHLDVGRHFFPAPFIKRYIDLIAMYKMNTFHWHLTEDQGWRIEIERYPRLTEVGAWRRETILEKNFDPYVGDGKPYGGFYSKDEVRDIVSHARSRFVTIIPEIELPGHSTAALAAYPELACTEGPFEVGTRWGVYQDVYCPKEETFEFLENVLDEVLALFPSQYVHIGGDEAPKTRWKESAVAQEVIGREGLADEAELQSWFIRRIERFLSSRGRRLVGWDEILEGGLPPDATVMSWRGMTGGIEAAMAGHDVIMTPTSHVYFDYYQGDPAHEPLAIGGYTPLEKVYAFEPVPDELSPEEARHVLGAQGNVWTEYIKTPEHVEYMVLPRMIALSEVVWSPREARDWSSFLARLTPHLQRLDRLGVRYRVPDGADPSSDQAGAR